MKTQTQLSRELFKKFLLETSNEDFNKIISEIKVNEDISPNWDEYLNDFNFLYEGFLGEDVINEKMLKVHLEKIDPIYKIPPPQNKKYIKKDLSNNDGSFFLLYLHNDRREKSCIFI